MAVFLLASTPPAPQVRVAVLALEGFGPNAILAEQASQELIQVLGRVSGVQVLHWEELAEVQQKRLRRLIRRCGDQIDCQVQIGRELDAQVLITGKAERLGTGANLDLVFVDVGSGKVLNKIGRSLAGQPDTWGPVLEQVLVSVLFPERKKGAIDLFVTPAGANVHLDGKLLVASADSQVHLDDLPVGRHTLRIEKPGYSDFFALIQVPYRTTVTVKANMQPRGSDSVSLGEDSRVSAAAPWYENVWLWTAVGVIIVGAATAVIVIER